MNNTLNRIFDNFGYLATHPIKGVKGLFNAAAYESYLKTGHSRIWGDKKCLDTNLKSPYLRQSGNNIDNILIGVRGQISCAKECKEAGVPLVSEEDGFVDPVNSYLGNPDTVYNGSSLRNIQISTGKEAVNNNDKYWFYDKEYWDKIVQENPEYASVL